MMGLGVWLLEQVAPLMEFIAPLMPGEVFPYFFTMEMFQRAMLALCAHFLAPMPLRVVWILSGKKY